MMVTFVSQCEKKALPRTRRVLDAFADRIGDNTWQTVITQEGLLAVKKLLRKTASKNTAVSCHWIRSRARSELVWVVGNKRKFDSQGVVPVNLTNTSFNTEEGTLSVIEPISMFSGIAGLFHDVGKANTLFQKKLDPNTQGKTFEPFRHEWVSLKIFQAFVGDLSDREWVVKLANINNTIELEITSALSHGSWHKTNPFTSLPPIARIIAWLIVTHHRLPVSPESNRVSLANIDEWQKCFDAGWNATRSVEAQNENEVVENWTFPIKTPLASVSWQINARKRANAILNSPTIWEKRNWLDQRFVSHLSRLSLMLSDHYYSSLPRKKCNPEWQDPNYSCYANTDQRGEKKQKLDEHNIGVCYNAICIAKQLLKLKNELPSLENDKTLMQAVPSEFQEKFGWQDKAYKKAKSLFEDTTKHGFFGINMASTGLGKTRANARIMHALSGDKSCRFSIALGLRTLTLQTGDAMKKDLKISDDEIAVLVGSQSVRELHQLRNLSIQSQPDDLEKRGSESANPLIDDNIEISHALGEFTGDFSKWLAHDEKVLRLIQAPVLVSTIDYLVPATEGVRGGRQIGPMLRLLTSDLVLDEPDDFGLEDMPALCRLVNWAGVLGSKVLLSTASLPPALAYALFEAYMEGRKHYLSAISSGQSTSQVICAWFDEKCKPQSEKFGDLESFKQAHQKFVSDRVKKLRINTLPLVRGALIPPDLDTNSPPLTKIRSTVVSSIHRLHELNHVIHKSGKRVSLGLVRMANINPLVALAKGLYSIEAEEGYQIHYCVYHSQFPLIMRSAIETRLDSALARHNEEIWWEQSGIEEKLISGSEDNHIFVVLATAVAEVGRDHDYDWAIAEPSSMRSIIQLAGRIQRHRNKAPSAENMHIISQNYKGLCGRQPAFCRPGFETTKLAYSSTDLRNLLEEGSYSAISAIPRIELPNEISPPVEGKHSDFIGLEHLAHFQALLGNNKDTGSASLWWKNEISWCAEAQLMQPFRKSSADDVFCLNNGERTNKLNWQEVDTKIRPIEARNTNKIRFSDQDIDLGRNVTPWFDIDIRKAMTNLSNQLNKPEKNLWRNFTEIRLRRPGKEEDARWLFHSLLGVYKELEEM